MIGRIRWLLGRRPESPANLTNAYPTLRGDRAAATVTPPSVRATSTGTGSNVASAVTLPTRQAGDALVVCVIFDNTIGVAANTGWTRSLTRISYDTITSLAVYRKNASNGTDETPFSGAPGTKYAYVCFAVSNPVTGYDVGAVGVTPGMPDNAAVAPTVTPTGTPSVLLNAYCIVDGYTLTTPGGQTATATVSTDLNKIGGGYESKTGTTATGTRTATASGSGGWMTASVIVK